MNIIPWRRNDSHATTDLSLDDFWDRLWGNGHAALTNRLPDVFQNRPFPAVNIAETEDGFSITTDCPGLEEKDFELQIMGKQLVISGERRWEEEKKGKEYRRVESQYGKFQRAVQLPDNASVEPGAINATYKKGVLTVTVPKLEKTPATKISVQAE